MPQTGKTRKKQKHLTKKGKSGGIKAVQPQKRGTKPNKKTGVDARFMKDRKTKGWSRSTGRVTKPNPDSLRFKKSRTTSKSTKAAIKSAKNKRAAAKRKRKIAMHAKAASKSYSTTSTRRSKVKTFSGHVPSVKASRKFKRPPAKKKK